LVRGEVFGSVIFIVYSVGLFYIAVIMFVQNKSIYDIGKWNSDDDSEMV